MVDGNGKAFFKNVSDVVGHVYRNVLMLLCTDMAFGSKEECSIFSHQVPVYIFLIHIQPLKISKRNLHNFLPLVWRPLSGQSSIAPEKTHTTLCHGLKLKDGLEGRRNATQKSLIRLRHVITMQQQRRDVFSPRFEKSRPLLLSRSLVESKIISWGFL